MRKYATHGFEVSRKVLCLLLTGMLLIQMGCTTTRVLKTVEQEELKTDGYKRLELQPGQKVRITYRSDSEDTELLDGWIKSITADAIIISNPFAYPKANSISFERIQKIEVIGKKMTKTGYAIIAVSGLTILTAIVIYIVFHIEYNKGRW